jgi:hypothetical protein
MSRAAITVVLSLVTIAFAQSPLDTQLIKISPQLAQQGLDPLHPNAVGHPVITGNSMNVNTVISQFTVTNYAAKTVTSIEYGWRIAAPAACSTSTLPVHWETATVNVNIPPAAEVDITTVESLSRTGSAPDLAAQARANHTSVVLVTIGLLKVTYADSSTWSDDEAVNSQNFDNGRAEKVSDCHVPTPKELQGKRN